MSYCNNTTDLQKEFQRIENYQSIEILRGTWVQTGETDVWYLTYVGDVELIWVNGVKYTDAETLVGLDGDGKYFFDSDDQTLHIQIGSDEDPSDYQIENKADWDATKTAAINDASAMIDARLNVAFPTPILPRSSREHTADTYDPDLVRACASLACALLIERHDPKDDNSPMLYRRAINPNPAEGEMKGIIDQYLDGTLMFQDQIAPREVGNWNIIPYASNTVTYSPELFGVYTGSMYKEWRIQVDTGGAPGTGTFKVSFDGGTNWDLTLQDMKDADQDEYRMYIANGVYVYWPNTTWVQDEYWIVYLYPLSDTATVQTVGTIQMTRR